MMRQLLELGYSYDYGLVENGNWNWWLFGGESSVQLSRYNRYELVGGFCLCNNLIGLVIRVDLRILVMVDMVCEVFLNVVDEFILQVCLCMF